MWLHSERPRGAVRAQKFRGSEASSALIGLPLLGFARVRQHIDMHHAFEVVPLGQGVGKKCVRGKWVELLKWIESAGVYEVRSRRVATKASAFLGGDMHTRSPAIRSSISAAARAPKSGRGAHMAFSDASIAFLHAQIDEDIYMLPPGVAPPGHGLRPFRALYGTRHTRQLW